MKNPSEQADMLCRHSVWGFEPTLKLWPFWLIFVTVWISAVLLTEILQIPKELHTSGGVASESGLNLFGGSLYELLHLVSPHQ